MPEEARLDADEATMITEVKNKYPNMFIGSKEEEETDETKNKSNSK